MITLYGVRKWIQARAGNTKLALIPLLPTSCACEKVECCLTNLLVGDYVHLIEALLHTRIDLQTLVFGANSIVSIFELMYWTIITNIRY